MDPLGALKAGRFVNAGRTMRLDAAVSMARSKFVALTIAGWAMHLAERMQHYSVSPFRKGLQPR